VVNDEQVLRKCSLPDCTKVEVSSQKFDVCQRCKTNLGHMVPYCGRYCQVKHWPVHREVCGVKRQVQDLAETQNQQTGEKIEAERQTTQEKADEKVTKTEDKTEKADEQQTKEAADADPMDVENERG